MKNVKYILLTFVLIFVFTLLFNKPLSAAVEKVSSVVVTNWPSLFNTREQNVDGSGNIKVHEQGTINVNLVNPSPIPVEVINHSDESSLEVKTVTVLDNVDATNAINSDFIDVRAYKKIGFYLYTDQYSFVNAVLKFSIDGVNDFAGQPSETVVLSGNLHAVYKLVEVAGPYARIYFNAGVDPANATVKLYLIP